MGEELNSKNYTFAVPADTSPPDKRPFTPRPDLRGRPPSGPELDAAGRPPRPRRTERRVWSAGRQTRVPRPTPAGAGGALPPKPSSLGRPCKTL